MRRSRSRCAPLRTPPRSCSITNPRGRLRITRIFKMTQRAQIHTKPFARMALAVVLSLAMIGAHAAVADTDAKVRDLMAQMTLDEKIGQMIQLNYSTYSQFNFKAPHEVELTIGAVIELDHLADFFV